MPYEWWLLPPPPLAVRSGFGELALLYSAPRAASVRATTDCRLWVMERQVRAAAGSLLLLAGSPYCNGIVFLPHFHSVVSAGWASASDRPSLVKMQLK